MTKLKLDQLNLKFYASLLWIISFLLLGSPTHMYGANTVNTVFEQNSTITGKVISADDNMALPGVNVIIKGTTNGVTTDFDGNYSINNVAEGDVLVFSFMGFETNEITVNTQSTINVSLKTDSQSLEEVVVVGYGTQKKETLTGSIEQVDSEVFTDQAVPNAGLALQGRTPGLLVTRNSSRPGDEDLNFLIRGASSVNGIQPLFVIDGVPAINDNAFTNMNANDIENISVLKGGSASVYGSRAAGGVILVTTKKGRGDVKVDISSILRIGTIGIRPPSPNMEEYGQLYLAAVDEDLAAGTKPNYFFWSDRPTLERIANGEEGWYDLPVNGNIWLADSPRFDEMFGNSTSSQHNVSVSGGNEISNFRISMGYDHNVGGLKVADDSADRYNFAATYNVDVSEKVHINTNVSYFHNAYSGPAGGLGRDAATYDAPLFPTYTPEGNYYSVFGGVNIKGKRNAIAQVIDGGRDNNLNEQLKLSAQAIYDITDHLNISGSYAFSKQQKERQIYTTEVELYSWQEDYAASINSSTYIEEETSNVMYQNYKTALNYTNSFGDHNVSGLLAIEGDLYENNGLRARRDGFIDYGVYDLDLGATDQEIETEGGGSTYGFYGYISRINYDYKGKYLFEVQGRRDGSSKFAEGSKWSNYGNFSAGWVISSEDFLKDSNFVNFLKLRGGYGELGSTAGIGNFGYLSTVSFGSSVFGQTTAAQQVNSRASSLFSSTTTWERIASSEIGVDFKLLDNKIFGSLDLYKKKNIGMLVRGIVPEVLGTSSPYTNIGDMETKGWEAMLGYRQQFGDWDVSVSANMSDSRNEITRYDGATTIYENLNSAEDGENIVGKPINSFYLWETDGYLQTQADVDAYYDSLEPGGILPSQTSSSVLRPGDMRVVDSNGDGKLDNDDLTYKGDAAVHYAYGLNFDVKWKNFDLGAFFQGALEHKIYRTGYFAQPFQKVWQNQSNTWLGRTWTEDNTDAEFPRLSTNSNISKWNYSSKDHILQNNRYIRLKSLIVGYNFPVETFSNTIDKLRIYFSGNDLWEATSVKDGYDPESTSDSGNATYPFMRTWAFGVSISL